MIGHFWSSLPTLNIKLVVNRTNLAVHVLRAVADSTMQWSAPRLPVDTADTVLSVQVKGKPVPSLTQDARFRRVSQTKRFLEKNPLLAPWRPPGLRAVSAASLLGEPSSEQSLYLTDLHAVESTHDSVQQTLRMVLHPSQYIQTDNTRTAHKDAWPAGFSLFTRSRGGHTFTSRLSASGAAAADLRPFAAEFTAEC